MTAAALTLDGMAWTARRVHRMHDSTSQTAPTDEGDRHVRIAWWLAAVAIILRIFHYFRNPPVWCDELWILRNITAKSFTELLGPLSDAQAAPPLFLWLERAVWTIFGNDILALRLPQLLASCGTILLLFWVGKRCLRPAAFPWAILLFGCCDPILNYTCEVKPYVIDAFLGTATLAFLIRSEGWQACHRAALFALMAPLIIFSSYPGCFICGGFLAALLPDVWTSRGNWRTWLAYSLAAGSSVLSFLALLLGPIRAQRTPALVDMYWDGTSAGRGNLLQMVISSVDSFLALFEHFWRPTGGVLLLPLLVGGGVVFHRNCQYLAMLVVPCLLAKLASLSQSYPFESRLLLFCMPCLCLLAAEGIAVILSRIRAEYSAPAATRVRRTGTGAVACAFAILLFLPIGKTVYFLFVPRQRLTHEIWPEPKIASQPSMPSPESR